VFGFKREFREGYFMKAVENFSVPALLLMLANEEREDDVSEDQRIGEEVGKVIAACLEENSEKGMELLGHIEVEIYKARDW
jgi:hypothetical protein